MKALRVGLLTAAYLFAALAFATPSSTIEQKNQNIEKSIRKAMAAFQVPGIAVAIVKNNQVVMSKGFGLTEYGTTNEVNGDTLVSLQILKR